MTVPTLKLTPPLAQKLTSGNLLTLATAWAAWFQNVADRLVTIGATTNTDVTSVDTSLSEEVSRAVGEEEALANATAAEAARATAAEETLATAAGVETARAEAAEEALGTSIADETSRAETAEALLAPKASPTLTGVPAAPTAAAGTSTTQIATTAFAAAAVGVEATRATTAEALLAPKASPTLTGVPAAPTAAAGTSTTQIATTAFAAAAVGVEATRATTAEALLAPKASPTLTGVPAAPTAAAGTSTTQIATTAFAAAAVGVEATRATTAEALLAPLANPVFTGGTTTQGPVRAVPAAADAVFIADAVAGHNRYILLRTGGKARWEWGGNNTAEGGANSGTDMFLVRCDDTGAAIDTCLLVSRATGLFTFYDGITVGGPCTINGVTFTSGPAAPTSVQPLGSQYTCTAGGVGSTLYISRGGGVWNAVAGV